ncbi:MAG: NADH:flavin oxidoreductase [Candidatus Methanoperedens sp.]|jgi:2,4-dienoyl-CoA reductase-like NADH-dependent reductase (Old Yellow Enzyme family)|nr:NADH:flavin oxidoreductase [Candidatus Methanoperedens sp.]PKL53147.1 MAG: hypothetical protein CVV36_08635 [Candidatus Methanoperedenaceae archaeon HGW-Methanoperedenaceae-1]
MNLNNILEPLHIKGVTIPNRIVFPAFQTNYATSGGFVTDRLLRMYEKLAQGGSGLIIIGAIAVSDNGSPNTNVLKVTSDKHIEGLEKLFSVIRENGSVPAAQLLHAGRQTVSAMTGHPVVAPSAIPCPVMKEMPLELDDAGIKKIQDDFADGAQRVKKAGAGLIELHGAFGYLIGSFLSPFSNKRTDKYGVDKTLFFTETIGKVRRKIGNLPISCRISADEYVEDGLTLDDTKKLAPRLVEAGADVISVAAGTYASMNHMAPTKEMGEGVHVHLAKAIRDVVDVPVICAGNVRSLQYANKIIREGKTDLAGIARPQLADPFFVRKSLDNQPFAECTSCNTCMYFLRGEPSVSCPQNPEL